MKIYTFRFQESMVFSPKCPKVSFILTVPADAICTQLYALTLPNHLWIANLVATRETKYEFLWDLKLDFSSGSSTLKPKSCSYLLWGDCTLNYTFNHILGLTLGTFHFHENWLVTCFPHAPGFGCSNQQHNFLP